MPLKLIECFCSCGCNGKDQCLECGFCTSKKGHPEHKQFNKGYYNIHTVDCSHYKDGKVMLKKKNYKIYIWKISNPLEDYSNIDNWNLITSEVVLDEASVDS